MTIIEIRPFRNGWEVYEGTGVQPISLTQGTSAKRANLYLHENHSFPYDPI
jgi:hypothetical protein